MLLQNLLCKREHECLPCPKTVPMSLVLESSGITHWNCGWKKMYSSVYLILKTDTVLCWVKLESTILNSVSDKYKSLWLYGLLSVPLAKLISTSVMAALMQKSSLRFQNKVCCFKDEILDQLAYNPDLFATEFMKYMSHMVNCNCTS